MGVKRVTYEDVVERINSFENNKSQLMVTKEQYENNNMTSKTKLRMKCGCGKDFHPMYTSMVKMKNLQCTKCANGKISFEDIIKFVDSENGNGCKLVTTKEEYIEKNMTTDDNLHLKCGCGEDFYPKFSNMKKVEKLKCRKCASKETNRNRKLSYETIVNLIEERKGEGCELLTTKEDFIKKDMNVSSPFHLKCGCGENFYPTYSNMKNRDEVICQKCAMDKLRTPYEEVLKLVKGEKGHGCILITTQEEYENQKMKSESKLHLKCRCDEDFYPTYNNMSKMELIRCTKCGKKEGAKKQRISYEEIKAFVEGEEGNGCKLLTTKEEYGKNEMTAKSIFRFICSCDETFETKFESFKSKKDKKRQCNECGKKLRVLNRTGKWFKNSVFSYEEVKNFIEGEDGNGCILITEKENYEKTEQKLDIKCACGNPFKVSFVKFKHRNKRQCNECSRKKLSFTTEEFKEKVFELVGNEYEVLGEYVNSYTGISFIHSS